MKSFVAKALIIALLCFLDLFKVASSDQRPMDIIDHFIGLAEPNNDDIVKRNSTVDGEVLCAVQIYNNSLQIKTGSSYLRICVKERDIKR